METADFFNMPMEETDVVSLVHLSNLTVQVQRKMGESDQSAHANFNIAID